MGKWAAGLGLVTWCVLGTVGCRKAEPVEPAVMAPVSVEAAPELAEAPAPEPVLTRNVDVQPALPAAPEQQEMKAEPEAEAKREQAPVQRTPPPSNGSLLEDDDRIWLSESAESARAGNANIPANRPTEEITIASGTVDGRVKRVRARTIEVADPEGNIYELRIDRRSRGLRQGRNVPLRNISEGTPVRASFDLVGNGASLARDIVLRR